MRKFYKLLTLLVAFATTLFTHAQDFSNKGKDFWVGYGYHERMNAGSPPGGSQDMILYFATDVVTTVTVTIPGLGYTQVYPNIPANTVFASNPIPKSNPDARLFTDGLQDKGIHITSDKPIIAYAHIYNTSVSGATILFPTNTLGKEYYSVNYTNNSNTSNANCWLYVVSPDTGTTTVEITPTAATVGGWVASTTYTVNLTQGQVYNVMGQLINNTSAPFTGVDLTGSHIKSVSTGTGSCKRIAVFSGSGRIAISCNGAVPSSDNYMVQSLPQNAWGKHYLTVPTASYQSTDGTGLPLISNFYRICVLNPATNVQVNGAPIGIPLTNNFYYQVSATNQPMEITSDQPIMVAQYLPSQSACGTGPGDGDPEVMYLSPVEQSINTVRWNACHPYAININKHYINVIITNAGTAISSFKLDGVPVNPILFQPHPSNPNYSYAVINVSGSATNPAGLPPAGIPHTVQSDSGFNAIAYGYGNAESYGYNAGTNVKDQYQFIQISNPYATVNFPAACKSQPFYFSIVLPYQPTQLQWIFGPALNAMGIADVTIGPNPPPVYDSTWVVNGHQLYRYRLPNPYVINTPGVYPIQVVAQNPTPDGCSGMQQIDYDLTVYDKPHADFTFTTTGCAADSVHFFGNPSNLNGRSVTTHTWTFGDGGTASIQNPVHKYNAIGAYNAHYSFITDVGCLSDTALHVVTLYPPPTAGFAVAPPTCVGQPTNFIDQSNTPNGTTISDWYWNFGDGSPVVHATNANPQQHIYSSAGTYTVTLYVVTSTGCQSVIFSQAVTISNRPVANFTFTGACLPSGSTQFTDQSTISSGTITQWAWNFGDGGTSTLQNPVHNYATTGPFNVTLTVISNSGCSKDTTKIMNTVYAQPHADFSMDSATSCSGGTVHFTDNSNAPNSTVTQWFWNFGDGGTSTLQNPSHSYAAPGTYLVKHWVISAASCMSDTMTKTVTVVPSPTASFTVSSPLCATQNITFTSTSVPNFGTITQYSWTINGTPTGGNNYSIVYSPPASGNYTVVLIVTTSNGCTAQATQTINVNPMPVANFTWAGACLPSGATQFTDQSTISSGTITSWDWTFGDGGSSNQQNPLHYYASTGPFTVTLTVIGTGGCQKDTTKIMNTVYAQPHADFTMDSATSCTGGTVHFTDNSNAPNSTVTQWFWNFGDGGTSTLQNPSHSYAAPGTYSVKHWVISAATCMSDTMTKPVTVVPLPAVSFTVSNPVCATQSVTFTSTSVPNFGTITQYSWTINGTPTGGNSSFINYTPPSAGTYAVVLTVTTSNGCSNQATQNVVVNPKPVSNFIFSNACLPTGAAQFTDQSTISSGTITQWAWNFGDGGTSTVQNPVHNYATTGPFNVTLVVTSNNGCAKDTVKVMNTVYAQPQAAFTAPPEVCFGTAVNFTDQSIAPNSTVTQWAWNFGDGGTSTVQNPSHSYVASGTYTVTLVVTSAAGCQSATATKNVIVNPLPTANFNISNPNCVNQTIVFNDESVANAGNIVQWAWTFGDGGNSTQQNPQHTYASIGTYNATLQVTTNKGCISTVLTKAVVVSPLPVANFGLPQSCLNDPYSQFTDSSTISDGTQSQFVYLWNFGDPNANGANPNTSTQQNPRHKYTATGPYNVTLTVTSNNGCASSITKQFFVNGAVPIPSYTLRGGNTHCSYDSIVLTDNSTVNPGTVIKIEIYWDYTNNPTIKTVDNNPSPGTIYNHIYPEFGTPATKNVTIRYVAYSGQTCLQSIDKVVTLLATPTVQFSAMAGICNNVPAFQITQAGVLNAIPGTGVFSGPGISPTGMFDPIAAGVGTHTIRYTYNATNGCTNYKEQTIDVFALPTVSAGPNRFMLEGGSIVLHASASGNGLTYLWTPNLAINNPTILRPTVSPPSDQLYTLIVTSSDGCKASSDVLVKVLKAPIIPNVFTPNGDGINDTWVILYLETYPGCTVDVFNRYGQPVYHSVGYNKPWDGRYKGNPLPAGTYYYVIDPKNGRQKMAGFVDIVR